MAIALQVIGLLSVSVAGFLAHPVAGFGILGISCLVFGIAVERSKDN